MARVLRRQTPTSSGTILSRKESLQKKIAEESAGKFIKYSKAVLGFQENLYCPLLFRTPFSTTCPTTRPDFPQSFPVTNNFDLFIHIVLPSLSQLTDAQEIMNKRAREEKRDGLNHPETTPTAVGVDTNAIVDPPPSSSSRRASISRSAAVAIEAARARARERRNSCPAAARPPVLIAADPAEATACHRGQSRCGSDPHVHHASAQQERKHTPTVVPYVAKISKILARLFFPLDCISILKISPVFTQISGFSSKHKGSNRVENLRKVRPLRRLRSKVQTDSSGRQQSASNSSVSSGWKMPREYMSFLASPGCWV